MMTRQDYEHIAWALRMQAEEANAIPLTLGNQEANYWRKREWDKITIAIANVFETNSNFNRTRFLRQSGYAHRPDGSMYPWVG